jgi:hypothetical protein
VGRRAARIVMRPTWVAPTMRILWLLLLVPLAGCLGGAPDVGEGAVTDCPPGAYDRPGIRIEEPSFDPIAPLVEADKWSFASTNTRTCNLPAIGWSALSEDGVPHKYIGEIDMRGDLDLGAVAVLGNGETPRVYLLNISNRAQPVVLSSIEQSGTYIVDVKISSDGRYLYTASQNIGVGEVASLPQLTGPTGFTVYDIADPADPRYVLTSPDLGYGCHMLAHRLVGNTDALFCVSSNIKIFGFERSGGNLAPLGYIEYFPQENGIPTPSWHPLSALLPARPLPLTSGPHDMTVQEVDGRLLMTVSHWDSGVRIVDVTDLPLVREVGAWRGEGAEYYTGNVHTAMLAQVGKMRYLIATPELTSPGEVPAIWVLDATDLANPTLVAQWTHPGLHESQGLYLTTHQWQVAPTGPNVTAEDVRIYLTYNHAGIWVLDLAAILADDDAGAILGWNLARAPLDQATSVPNAVLSTWDVNVVEGYIYGSDRATGLWVFHYGPDRLGDPSLTGFA